MDEIEEWCVIKDYPNYMVSSLGRVKSIDRIVKNYRGEYLRKGCIMVGGFNTKGYPIVCLSKDGKQKSLKVHRLVAEAFIQNPENKPTVDHISGDKTDNRVSNLRWATYSEQQDNEVTTIKRPVLQLTLDGELVKEWSSLREIINETNNRHVCSVLTGKRKTALGFLWKYKEKGAA